ncbi:hypothetical protein San01_27310 [Streptomyces angustmyceticus]|uniref:Uncharacterized protein n=1 Tax=Streptomyces angustmyceticus TaxID=285578 RepID=A0A5J4LCA3_9ACTN|nr:hypothetical protein San01_27310 [Streptomyces angustmyceticus]
MIGALSQQIRGAAIDALFNGTEKITKAGLKAVPLDVAAGSPHFRGPRSPMTHENVRVLPFQVRPRPGEGIRSFIGRLAHANHLPPRYLRTYLCEPPEHLGLPSWTRLAAAAGRARRRWWPPGKRGAARSATQRYRPPTSSAARPCAVPRRAARRHTGNGIRGLQFRRPPAESAGRA